MAIFHLSAKVVSRGAGQSVIAKAAYNSRSKLEDERTGLTKNYSYQDGLVFSGIFAPKGAPEWARDRQQLWNSVERREDESNRAASAQLAREIQIALPHELTDQQREWLVKDFVREQLTRKGMVADVNIHAPGGEADERNYHAHILVTMREILPDGFGSKVREWNGREQVEQWRESWEHLANKHLERHGHEARIDRRSLEAQGIEREPTTHRGPHVDALERRGIEADNTRQSLDTATELAALKAELAMVNHEIAAIERSAERIETSPSTHIPQAANNNEFGIDMSPVTDALEAAPLEALNFGNRAAAEIGGGFKMLATILPIFGNDGPPPPQSKEEAEGRRNARLQQAIDSERLLHDRAYRREYEKQQREARQREEEERERQNRERDYRQR